jgi:hypothetical protein
MKVQPAMQCCPATKFHYLTVQAPRHLRNIKLWRITNLQILHQVGLGFRRLRCDASVQNDHSHFAGFTGVGSLRISMWAPFRLRPIAASWEPKPSLGLKAATRIVRIFAFMIKPCYQTQAFKYSSQCASVGARFPSVSFTYAISASYSASVNPPRIFWKRA